MTKSRSARPALVALLGALVSHQAEAVEPAFHTVVAADNPVLWYRFNEASGNAVNYGSLGATHDAQAFGTPIRGVPTSSGDTGVSFDSGGDYFESLNVVPGALTGNPTFTAEAIFFVPTNGGSEPPRVLRRLV